MDGGVGNQLGGAHQQHLLDDLYAQIFVRRFVIIVVAAQYQEGIQRLGRAAGFYFV